MKYFFSIVFLTAVFNCNAQVTVTVKWSPYKPVATSDTIYYNSNKKLNWADFKGQPERGSEAVAITSSGFGYSAGIKTLNNKTTIAITVYCYFSKQNSWVIKGKETAYALTHEQHHFDVTWIVANAFFQKLKNAAFTRHNYNSVLDSIYKSSMTQLQTMQNEYDGETRNGRLQPQQAEWNKKITNQLNTIATN